MGTKQKQKKERKKEENRKQIKDKTVMRQKKRQIKYPNETRTK